MFHAMLEKGVREVLKQAHILSMLSGTPVIAIEYEFKTSEMMHFFELDDFVLDINDIDVEHFKHIIGTLIDNKDEINKKTSAKLAELKVLANRNADLVACILALQKFPFEQYM